MPDIEIGEDAFARAIEDILSGVGRASEEALDGAVSEGARVSRDEWRQRAPAMTGEYARSIGYRVDRTGKRPQATVFSRKPGLPHLLEKGHATIGGGFVPGRPHVAPAAEAGFDAAMEALEEGIEL